MGYRSIASELALGVLFVLAYAKLGLDPGLALFLVALTLLAALVLYDLAHQILPPKLLAAFTVVSVFAGYVIAPTPEAFAATLPVAAVEAALLFLLYAASRGKAMGFSDAPLALGLAVLTGNAAFWGFLYAFWIGAAIGITILVRRPRGARMGVEVPFAPFLAAGFLLAYFLPWTPLPLFGGLG